MVVSCLERVHSVVVSAVLFTPLFELSLGLHDLELVEFFTVDCWLRWLIIVGLGLLIWRRTRRLVLVFFILVLMLLLSDVVRLQVVVNSPSLLQLPSPHSIAIGARLRCGFVRSPAHLVSYWLLLAAQH